MCTAIINLFIDTTNKDILHVEMNLIGFYNKSRHVLSFISLCTF